MHIGTRYVILAKHWMWLPDDDFMWTETCWSSFYSFNYFNNLRILKFVCIIWTIKCLILLTYGATMKYIEGLIFSLKLYQNVRFLLWLRQAVLTNNTYGFLLLHLGTRTRIRCHSTTVEWDKERECLRKLNRERKNLSWLFRGNRRIIEATTGTWTGCSW